MTPKRIGLVLACLAWAVGACGSADSEAGPAMTAGTLSVLQADLYYVKLGAGDPIVVLHGGPGLDHSYLRPWLDPLSETNEVIFYDQRGLGGSNAALDSTTLNMSTYLTDLDRIRERVAGRDRITLLAHSWGAIPALLYAIEAPERLDALILVNPVEPGSRFQEQADANVAERRDPADVAAIDSLAATTAFAERDPEAMNRVFFHMFRGTFADPSVADRSLSLDLHRRTARQGQRVATLLMAPLQGLDFWDRLEGIEVPTLIVHGAHDPIPPEVVESLHEALPQSRLSVIEDAGHFPFIESPEAFFAAIRDFLSAPAPTTP